MRNEKGEDIGPIEVWFNELRLTGLDERGGYAGLAKAEMNLADLGNLSVAGNYNSLGWGGIDQKIDQRALETNRQYDANLNIELSKFLPKKQIFAYHSILSIQTRCALLNTILSIQISN